MNLQQLVTFCTVIAEGNMTAAAEKLYLTQPAVSQQIRNLEEELGVNLLVRGVRQAKPTLQGQLLYDYAKRIIALTQQAQVAIQSMGEGVTGALRIGTTNSLGLYMVSPVIGLFLKHNSKIRIKLVYAEGPEIYRQIKAGELDAAILPDVEKEFGKTIGDLQSQYLMKDEMWLVGSGRDASLPQTISIAEFASRPMVVFSEKYPAFQKMLNSLLASHSIEPDPVFETANVGTLKRVIESGLGWGFLPAHSIRKQVRMGRMTQIDVEEVKYAVNLMYYSRGDEESAPKTDVFFRALRQQGFGG